MRKFFPVSIFSIILSIVGVQSISLTYHKFIQYLYNLYRCIVKLERLSGKIYRNFTEYHAFFRSNAGKSETRFMYYTYNLCKYIIIFKKDNHS